MLQFLTLLSLALSLVLASAVPARSGPVKIDFSVKRSYDNTVHRVTSGDSDLARRDAYSLPTVDGSDITYYSTIYVGLNKQEVLVLLDTGSSILWVPQNHYDHTTSTSAKDTGKPFKIGYLSGPDYTGEYYQDTVTLGDSGATVTGFEFGVSGQDDDHGLMGVADLYYSTDSKDANIVWAMKDQGYTPNASYSLYLGPDHGSGSILFGGVDVEKFEGNELTYYDVSSYELHSRVPVTEVTFNGKTLAQLGEYVLDSGTTLNLVAEDLFNEMITLFDATLVNGMYVVDCNQPTDKFIEFNFGQNVIKVSYADSVARVGSDTCWLGFAHTDGVQILGDTFLRSAYVFYDFSYQVIGLGQAVHTDDSYIVST